MFNINNLTLIVLVNNKKEPIIIDYISNNEKYKLKTGTLFYSDFQDVVSYNRVLQCNNLKFNFKIIGSPGLYKIIGQVYENESADKGVYIEYNVSEVVMLSTIAYEL